jgi:hypothetical protein
LTTDVLLEKLELPASPGWNKTIRRAKHEKIRSSASIMAVAHQGYAPLVSYSINGAPITIAEGNAIKELVARASGRPVLVKDPTDFFAPLQPRHTPQGTFRMGLLKRVGADYLSPSVVKVYGAQSASFYEPSSFESNFAEVFLRSLYFRSIFYVENGQVEISDGLLLPFTLDPITRETRIGGSRATPPADLLSPNRLLIDGYPSFPQEPTEGYNPLGLRAEFIHYTPMVITEFSLTAIGGNRLQMPAVAGGSAGNCEGYFLSITLDEVIPQFDPLLTFYGQEANPVSYEPEEGGGGGGSPGLAPLVCLPTMAFREGLPVNGLPTLIYFFNGSFTNSPNETYFVTNYAGSTQRSIELQPTIAMQGDQYTGAYVEGQLRPYVPALSGPLSANDFSLSVNMRVVEYGTAQKEGLLFWAMRQSDKVYIGPLVEQFTGLTPFTLTYAANQATDSSDFNLYYELDTNTSHGPSGLSGMNPDWSETGEPIYFGFIVQNRITITPSNPPGNNLAFISVRIVWFYSNFTITMDNNKCVHFEQSIQVRTQSAPGTTGTGTIVFNGSFTGITNNATYRNNAILLTNGGVTNTSAIVLANDEYDVTAIPNPGSTFVQWVNNPCLNTTGGPAFCQLENISSNIYIAEFAN